MPTWVGDVVMAMPTLRALRALYPQAHISALIRSPVRPMLESCPWVDRILTIRAGRKGISDSNRRNLLNLSRRLAAGKFDTAVLLPNSFRTALLVRLAGIPRRVGYDRDGRGSLLTDRLLPRRGPGGYVPVPMRDYYLSIASYLGANDPDGTMALFTRPDDDARADAILAKAGIGPNDRLVLINPGANYGDTKIWYPDRFAAVGDQCVREFGAKVAITGAPKERHIVDAVMTAAREPMVDLTKLGLDLTLLKSIVKRSQLMISNDTGPRHIAIAFGKPAVTIFGPTDPTWTEIGYAAERYVRVPVYCGPCHKKKCPMRRTPDDHICMKRVEPGMVIAPVRELWPTISAPSQQQPRQQEAARP